MERVHPAFGFIASHSSTKKMIISFSLDQLPSKVRGLTASGVAELRLGANLEQSAAGFGGTEPGAGAFPGHSGDGGRDAPTLFGRSSGVRAEGLRPRRRHAGADRPPLRHRREHALRLAEAGARGGPPPGRAARRRPGRSRVIDAEGETVLKELVAADNDATLAEYAAAFTARAGHAVPGPMVRKALKRLGLARKKDPAGLRAGTARTWWRS